MLVHMYMYVYVLCPGDGLLFQVEHTSPPAAQELRGGGRETQRHRREQRQPGEENERVHW